MQSTHIRSQESVSTALLLRNSPTVAERIRRFKANSPRNAELHADRLPGLDLANVVRDSTPGELRTLRRSVENNLNRDNMAAPSTLSHPTVYNSVEDIMALLRAKASESVPESVSVDASTMSGIIEHIRERSSVGIDIHQPPVTDILLTSPPKVAPAVRVVESTHVDKPRTKDLLRKLNISTGRQPVSSEAPQDVITRIKQRLQVEPRPGESLVTVSPTKALQVESFVDFSILTTTSTQSLRMDTVGCIHLMPTGPQLALVRESDATNLQVQSTRICSLVSSSTVGIDSPESSHPSGIPVPTLGHLPVRRQPRVLDIIDNSNWRRHIESEIARTRESIYYRIKL